MDCFLLPMPPSVNRAYRSWRGRVVLTKEGKTYKADVAKQLYNMDFSELYHYPKLCFAFTFYKPDRRRRDVQNYTKILFDALENVVMENDSQTWWYSNGWQSDSIVKGGAVKVCVWAHEE